MKKIISVLIIVLMIASLVAAAVNGWSDEEYVRSGDNGTVIVPYVTDKDIMIDGTLSPGEWSETNKLALEGKKTMKTWYIGEFEGTIDFYCSWGEAGFYIAAVIYDDQIEKGASNEGALATRFQIGLNPAGIICNDYMGLFFSLTPVLESDRVALMRHYWQTTADDGFFVGEDEGYTGKYTFIQDGENVVGWNLECIIPWDMIATGDRYTDLDEKDEIYLTSFSPKDENRKRAFCTAAICYIQHYGPESYSISSTARTATDGDASKWTVDSHDLNFLFALPDETDRTTETEYFTENKEPNETTQPVTVDTEPETEPEPSTDSAGVAGDINGDGEVNNKDVVTLFRYVSSARTGDDPKYDYNGDGLVDNKDVVSLFRFLSTAGEDKSNYTSEDCFNFTLLPDGTYAIEVRLKYKYTAVDLPDIVRIPPKHNGKPVTRIKESAFIFSSDVTGIILPESITEIGYEAFNGCSNLQYNEYGGGLYLGSENNPYMSLIKAKDDSVGDIIIHKNTKIICDRAFEHCENIESIIVEEGNPVFYSSGNCLIETSSKELILGCKNSVIPDDGSVTSIGDYAFSLCRGLISLTIPDGVTSIGDGAFWGCTNLVNVVIPHGVTSIGNNTFYYCTSLTSVTIPDSVTSIGAGAFSSCYNLTYNDYDNAYYLGNANNPYYVLIMAKNKSITTVNINENTRIIFGSAFYGCSNLTSITIPDNVASIGNDAFSYCSNLISVTIGDGVTKIGDDVFYCCSSLTSVTIPNNVTSIGYSAFSFCSSLTSVTIPNDVTSIGHSAFSYCSSLTSVIIPDSVTSMGDSMFWCCTGLVSVTIPDSLTSINSYTFGECRNLTSVKIPDGVKLIGSGAFQGCSSLASVTIPDGVTTIGDNAFTGCDSLTKINIPAYVTSIGNYAFCGCNSLVSITVSNDNKVYHSKNNCIIETESKTLIAGCKSSVIPDDGSVISIGNSAFSGCSGLTSMNIPGSVKSVGHGVFQDCRNLTSVTVNNGVTSIGDYAFFDCNNLESITLPDSLTSIGDYAFVRCKNLTSVTIPDGITRLQWWTFNGCSGLTDVTIPASVTEIEYNAFAYCENLTSIHYNGTMQEWKSVAKNVEYWSQNHMGDDWYDWNYETGEYTVYCTDGNLTKSES